MTGPLATARRYWETVRWLRPEQIVSRVRLSAARPSIAPRPAPPLRAPSGGWKTPARRRPSLVAPRTFRLLNEDGALDGCGWDGPERDTLWRYNQHYFDDLNADGADARRDWHRALLADWLARNPPGEGTGWEPYPTSLRIVNWIKWALGGGALEPALVESLAVQARHLAGRLEFHLLGNHLFANAKALVFAGLWFEGEEADEWRRTGFEILARQTGEQILDDGGQFELSPMYHALALEDVLDLVNVARTFRDALAEPERALVAQWAAVAPKMRAWLAALCHPDGEIAFFNDAAFGVAPHRGALEAYADRLVLPAPAPPGPMTWASESGYARLSQPDAVLLCDMAPVGPDYLPGHAHADTLSFELSLFGARVFVNSGTSVYGDGAERLRQRGTAAHNTVVVDGANSSDVWSGFRVGARARPKRAGVEQNGDRLIADCAHDGYRRLPGGPIHRRRWELSPRRLRVLDALSAPGLPAEARFHLHPAVTASIEDERGGRLTLPDGRLVVWTAEGGPARLEQTSWHPEFGVATPNACLVLPLAEARACLDVRWS